MAITARRIRRGLLPVMLVFLAAMASLFAPAAHASVDDFSFDSYEVDFYLVAGEDGHAYLYASETWVAHFPDHDQNRGLSRGLVESESGVAFGPEVLSVTDAGGADVAWSTESDADTLYVLTGDDSFVHGVNTYVIDYTMSDVVVSYADEGVAEFYWDVLPALRAQPIDEVTIRLHVRGAAALEMLDDRRACYLGEYGSTVRCDISAPEPDTAWPADIDAWASDHTEAAGDTVVLTATASGLVPYDGMTIAVGFDPRAFPAAPSVEEPPTNAVPEETDYTPPYDPSELIVWLGGIAAAVAAAGVAATGWARRRITRSPDDQPIVAEYTPPPGLSPEMAAVLAHKPKVAFAAQIVQLAVKDVLEIHDGAGGRDVRLELVDPEKASSDEKSLLKGVFGSLKPGAERALSDLRKMPRSALRRHMTKLPRRLRSRGYVEEAPKGTETLVFTTRCVLLTLVVLGVATLIPVAMASDSWLRIGAWGLLAILVAATVLSFVIPVPTFSYTDKGRAAMRHLAGIKEYLALAETERLRLAQSPTTAERVSSGTRPYGDVTPGDVVNLYEKLLPYAIVLGEEKQWAEVIRLADPTAATLHTSALSIATDQAFRSVAVILSEGVPAVTASSGSSGGSSSAGDGISFSGGSDGGGFSGGGGGGGSVGGR